MTGDMGSHDETAAFDWNMSRRTFGKVVGGSGLLAAATDPTVADARRETDRTTAADLNGASIGSSFTPDDWDVVGPFQYQRRGVETGWLVPNGGEAAFADGEQTPSDDQRFQSAFAGGATVKWAGRSADGSTVSLDFTDRIDPTGGELTPLTGESGLFDDFQDWFGIGGVQYAVGYAFASFDRDQAERAVLETDASVLWLNGRRYEESPVGVVFQEGTNYLLAKQVITLASGSVSVSFRPPEADVEINDLAAFRGTPQNAILPDLRVGESTDRPACVRVTNTTGDRVENATLRFAPDSGLLEEQTVEIDPPLVPFETRRINTRVKTDGEVGQSGGMHAQSREQKSDSETTTVSGLAMTSTYGEIEPADGPGPDEGGMEITVETESASVTARVEVNDEIHEREIPLRIRTPDEAAWQTTFTSEIDESVQEFSIREPANPDADGPFDLVVSLHGAGVNSINQAQANISREAMYVLAPGARGPSNYDHEDFGRLDDLEAFRIMKERYDIDENHVYLSGHSMGGHGTWHVGLTNPDRFAALGPSAGWTDHETYITVTFDRDKLHTYPGIKAVLEKSLQKNLALPKTENAVDGTLPTFVLHGGEDESVPTLHPRTYVRALANHGLSAKGEIGKRYSKPDPDAVDVAFLEVPGQPHYWDAGIGPGNDSVNHPDMFTYLRANERDPYPDRVRFFTTNLRVEDSKYWVTVTEQNQVHAPTIVDAEVTTEGITIQTENVANLELDLRVLRKTDVDAPQRATINGETKRLPGRGGKKPATVDVAGGGQVSRGSRGKGQANSKKSADQYGPLQEVHYDPYRLVYGTGGDDSEVATNYTLANIRSQRLITRARAPATVIPDIAVDRQVMREYNLVLFGRPSSNSVLRGLQSDLPVEVDSNRATVAEETYTGDLGVEYVYPNPRASENLVQVETGISLAGLQLTGVRNWIPTQTPSPDYQIFDNSIRYQAWNASLAAGFFDADWEISDNLGYLRPR